MRGNFRFKMDNQDKTYGAICNPFVNGYIVAETGKILTNEEVEEMLKTGQMIIIN